MADRFDNVQCWLHNRICTPSSGCSGPREHRQQAIEVILLAEDKERENLRDDVCGTAMRYVDTKFEADYHDLEKATLAWKQWFFGGES